MKIKFIASILRLATANQSYFSLSWEASIRKDRAEPEPESIEIGTGGDLKPKISLGEVVSVILLGLDYKLMQLLT